jgi:hypothetical protein
MQDFEYKTRLVFEGDDGAEQHYYFRIVKPEQENPHAAPVVVTQDDLAAPVPWDR